MMLFENVLTGNDKDLIQAWINTYATHDVTASHAQAPLSKILRYWNSEKTQLFKMFGEKLILSKEVEINREEGDLEREVSESLYCRAQSGERSLRNFYTACQDFVHQNYKELGEDCRWNLLDLFGLNCLTKNEYNGKSFVVPVPTGKAIQVQKGCKPVKILGKIAQAYELPHYEEFRLAHSRILNQKKVKGELCISIHPLDYMTMSDNDCDWESCMSWRSEGCYRRGTVEMMNSDSVIVAYLRAKDDMRFYDHYWNNKKWRQLFIVQEDYIVGVKGYPYQHNGLADEVLNWLAELSEKNLGVSYAEEVKEFEHNTWFASEEGVNWRLSFETNTMYNDFGATNHRAKLAVAEKGDYEYCFNYSGEEVCMWCGDNCVDYDEEGTLLCNDCYCVTYCSSCEERVSYDDLIEVDGEQYCSYCYENYVQECPVSGTEVHENNMTKLYLLPNGVETVDVYKANAIKINPWGVENMSRASFSEYFTLEQRKFARETNGEGFRWYDKYYIQVKDLTEEGLRLFDIYDQEELDDYVEGYSA